MIKKIASAFAGMVMIGTLVAGQAHASNGWICDALDRNPTKSGVIGVIVELMSEGYTENNGGPELFAQTIVTQCPEYIPLVEKVASQLA